MEAEMVAHVPGTRRVERERRVRMGDAGPDGRARLDAIARFLQDVSDDDTTEAELDGRLGWVVRRAALRVDTVPRLGEPLRLSTWCGGLGARWAERRVSIVGAAGGRVDAAVLWVCVDRDGRPVPLSEQFVAIYGPSANGRAVRARLHHGSPPDDAAVVPWTLRHADLDVLGHVNNAASWAAVHEVLAASGAGPVRSAEIEYRAPVTLEDPIELRVLRRDERVEVWWCSGATVLTSAVVVCGP